MTTFVILGASGDLTKKKLIPAIYNLVKKKKLNKFAIVGVSRSKINIIIESKKYIKNPDDKILKQLNSKTYHFESDFYSDKFNTLNSFIKNVEKKHKLKNERIFYLATLPQHFESIINSFSKNKIKGKIIFEKPFGNDLKSAKHINKTIKSNFKEKDIYRIDHYLGKDLVQNLSVLRFTNEIFEPIWFLSNNELSSGATGHNLIIDGGWTIW